MRRVLGAVALLALLGGCALNAFRPLFEETGRGASHPVMEACLRDATDRYRAFQVPWETTVMTCIGQGFAALPIEDRRCRRPAVASEVCTAWISHRRHSMTFDSFSDVHYEMAAVPEDGNRVRVDLARRLYWSGGAIEQSMSTATYTRP